MAGKKLAALSILRTGTNAIKKFYSFNSRKFGIS